MRALEIALLAGIVVEGLPFFMRRSGQEQTMPSLDRQRERLLDCCRQLQSCVVAMSAGVDSAVVAQAAHLALGSQALAVTADSPSLARSELQAAQATAAQIGIRHLVVSTTEIEREAYQRNASDRCYHCKQTLYTSLAEVARQHGLQTLVNGANADDSSDYRPGLQAAAEHQVRSPLAECGITKAEVRQLAQAWQLPVWDKPASPCLSSRLAYGERVTPERLAMVEQAEAYLKSQGLADVRVRYHRDDMARIEVPVDQIERLCQAEVREPLIVRLKTLGFKFVALDLEGFRSGSLNQVLPVESLLSR